MTTPGAGSPEGPKTYRGAGVDIDAGEEFVRLIKPFVRKTFGPQVVGDLGGFGGVIRVVPAGGETLLVASIDGVGTKLLLAAELDRLENVGRDLVHHCVNDIAVLGARPLFFLDYIGAGRLEPARAAVMVRGMAAACAEQGMALLGGETAEMPGLYQEGHYDLVGAIVGTVDRSRFVDARGLAAGDRLIGLGSDGLHTNGYSLARRALFGGAGTAVSAPPGAPAGAAPHAPDNRPPELGGASLADALLAPHRCYAPALFELIDRGWLKGAAHITGGGIPGNLVRILPGTLDARVRTDGWSIPPLFRIIAAAGPVESAEMFRAFNMGIGLIAVVDAGHEAGALELLAARGESVARIGELVPGSGTVRLE